MKLLGWMHNKFWQSGVESVKDFTIANPCMCLSAQTLVDDEDICLKPGFSPETGQDYERPSFGVESNNILEKYENSLSHSSDFFHGFLTIGTLGSEPSTPTFSSAFENMIELPEKVTEDDLKLISYELEKFLEAETKEDGCDQSPERTSPDNIITVASKHREESEEEKNGKILTCPLQGYLFGSTEVNESSKMEVEKKKILVKNSNKSALSFVKRIMKKLSTSLHGSSTYDLGDSYSTKNKLQKVVQKFQRKIHLESSTTTNEGQKSQKYTFENAFFDDNFDKGRMMNEAEDDRITSGQEFISKEEMYHWKTNLGLPPLYEVENNASRTNRGHWIMTDSEYFVLEL